MDQLFKNPSDDKKPSSGQQGTNGDGGRIKKKENEQEDQQSPGITKKDLPMQSSWSSSEDDIKPKFSAAPVNGDTVTKFEMVSSKEVGQMSQQFNQMGISGPKMGAEMMQEPKQVQIGLVENEQECSGQPNTFFKVMDCSKPQGPAFALKMVHPDHRGELKEGEYQGKLIEEAEFQATLNYPGSDNIVRVIQFGTFTAHQCQQAKCAYVMQELADGELYDMLFEAIKDAKGKIVGYKPHKWLEDLDPLFKEQLARYFLREMINGLEYLHNAGQIRGPKAQPYAHLDIKLHNVLVDKKGLRFKIADFGLAKPFQQPLENSGTLEYKAPEIFTKKWTVSDKQDVFALGHSLVMMLTGLPIFASAEESDPLYKLVANAGHGLDKFRNKDEDEIRKNLPEKFGIAKRIEKIENMGQTRLVWDRCDKAFDQSKVVPAEFKDLVHHMLLADPKRRASLQQVKDHEWMRMRPGAESHLDTYTSYADVQTMTAEEFFKNPPGKDWTAQRALLESPQAFGLKAGTLDTAGDIMLELGNRAYVSDQIQHGQIQHDGSFQNFFQNLSCVGVCWLVVVLVCAGGMCLWMWRRWVKNSQRGKKGPTGKKGELLGEEQERLVMRGQEV